MSGFPPPLAFTIASRAHLLEGEFGKQTESRAGAY